MSFLTLAFGLSFILIPLALSKTLKLDLERDTIIATIRSVVQLLAVGYVLQFVLTTESFVYVALMVALIITVATLNARNKGRWIKGITWKLGLTFVTIELLTQGVMIGFGIMPATAQYIIPVSGMLIGNAMVLSIVFLNRFAAEVEANRDEMELILTLGGTPKQAVRRQLISSIKASMIPTIESQKTIGLVQLPGMMSGQIIGGAPPLQAVQYQIIIVFALLTCATVASVMIGFLSYPALFNQSMQLMKQEH